MTAEPDSRAEVSSEAAPPDHPGPSKIPRGYGRIIRDESGNIVDVELAEDEDGRDDQEDLREKDMEELRQEMEDGMDPAVLRRWVRGANSEPSTQRVGANPQSRVVEGEDQFLITSILVFCSVVCCVGEFPFITLFISPLLVNAATEGIGKPSNHCHYVQVMNRTKYEPNTWSMGRPPTIHLRTTAIRASLGITYLTGSHTPLSHLLLQFCHGRCSSVVWQLLYSYSIHGFGISCLCKIDSRYYGFRNVLRLTPLHSSRINSLLNF